MNCAVHYKRKRPLFCWPTVTSGCRCMRACAAGTGGRLTGQRAPCRGTWRRASRRTPRPAAPARTASARRSPAASRQPPPPAAPPGAAPPAAAPSRPSDTHARRSRTSPPRHVPGLRPTNGHGVRFTLLSTSVSHFFPSATHVLLNTTHFFPSPLHIFSVARAPFNPTAHTFFSNLPLFSQHFTPFSQHPTLFSKE